MTVWTGSCLLSPQRPKLWLFHVLGFVPGGSCSWVSEDGGALFPSGCAVPTLDLWCKVNQVMTPTPLRLGPISKNAERAMEVSGALLGGAGVSSLLAVAKGKCEGVSQTFAKRGGKGV